MQQVTAGSARFAHRIGDVVLTVSGEDGAPLANADVTIEQTRHAFEFGNIGFDLIPLANGDADAGANDAHLAQLWLDLFNTATLPFYWGRYEPQQGNPQEERLRATAQWFTDRSVGVKGHPLVWHTVAPPWLLEFGTDEIERLQRDRIRREVGAFAGLIDTWDAINEAVIMPVFDKEDNGITRLALDRGRFHMIRMAFEEARSANPGARLVLNDFDLSSAYECLIEGVLEAGIRIDAIGLQTHMHQGYWGEDAMLAMVDRFARYGIPLHLTETSLVSGELMPKHIVDLNDFQPGRWPGTEEGEARQADEIVRHYRSLVGHPAVETINYWGLSDRGAWLGAPIGLVREDGSPKPSYDALHSVVKGEWWVSPTVLRTDDSGRIAVRGFAGDYRVSAGGADAAFSVPRGVADAAAASLSKPPHHVHRAR